MEKDLFNLGNALVDYSGVAKTVNDLQGRFSLLQLLDLCVLVEGIVLYEQLIMIGTRKLPDMWEPVLKPLLENNVLVLEQKKSRPIELAGRPNRRDGFDSRTGYSLEDAWYEAGRLLGAEKEHHCPSLALLRQKPFYKKNGYVGEDHSICDLFGRYQQFSDAIQTIRKQTQLPIQPYIVVPIPPIPLMVLKRSQRPDEFMTNALSIRDEFRVLRSSLKALREDLADPFTPPLQKRKAIESWNKSWLSLGKYNDASSMVEVALASNNLVDYAGAVGGLGLDSIKWSNLIEKIIQKSADAFYKWRVRLLHKAAKFYLKTSDGEINREVERIFHYEISRQDIDGLKNAGIELQ
jgi:hypothetical protein